MSVGHKITPSRPLVGENGHLKDHWIEQCSHLQIGLTLFFLRGTFEIRYLGDAKSESLQFFSENVELEQAHHLSRFSASYTQYPERESSAENHFVKKFSNL